MRNLALNIMLGMLCAAVVALLTWALITLSQGRYFVDNNTYNYVELQSKYKNYVIIDKMSNDEEYCLILRNPCTYEEYKVYISSSEYYNGCYVTDTIK